MLTDRKLSADRILANDMIYNWWLGGWAVNHVRINSTSAGPNVAGANTLYGDGHVAWKPEAMFDSAKMIARDPSVAFVRGGGGPPMDASFY
jgi:prepilin-type processing-associated H-X9-DG protein